MTDQHSLTYRRTPPDGIAVLVMDGDDVVSDAQVSMTAGDMAQLLALRDAVAVDSFKRSGLPPIIAHVVAAVREADGVGVPLSIRKTVERDIAGRIVAVVEEPIL